jgi:hypothetical protein
MTDSKSAVMPEQMMIVVQQVRKYPQLCFTPQAYYLGSVSPALYSVSY